MLLFVVPVVPLLVDPVLGVVFAVFAALAASDSAEPLLDDDGEPFDEVVEDFVDEEPD